MHDLLVDITSCYPRTADCQIPNIGFFLEYYLGCKRDGTLVEIGAHDGVAVSNSLGAIHRGWTAILVEPVPEFASRCRANLHNYPNVRIVETAVTSPGIESITLRLAGVLTTTDPGTLEEYQRIDWAKPHVEENEIVVPASTLDDILAAERIDSDFDLLIVDVEGHEEAVFRGFNLTRWRPRMLVVELSDNDPHRMATRAASALTYRHILESGYTVVYKDATNTVLVRSDVWERSGQQ